MRNRLVAVTLLLLALTACGEKPRPKPVSEPGEKVYVLKGTIVARDAEDNSLRIDHEAVPGFMEAMTMDYPLRGASVTALPPDQAHIEARLHVRDDRYWISDVRKRP